MTDTPNTIWRLTDRHETMIGHVALPVESFDYAQVIAFGIPIVVLGTPEKTIAFGRTPDGGVQLVQGAIVNLDLCPRIQFFPSLAYLSGLFAEKA